MLLPDFLFPGFLVFPPANRSNFSHCIYLDTLTAILWLTTSKAFYYRISRVISRTFSQCRIIALVF